MGRLPGFGAGDVTRVAERLGWSLERRRGSHLIYRKESDARNLSVPNHRVLKEGTLRSLVHTMGLTVDEFLELARG